MKRYIVIAAMLSACTVQVHTAPTTTAAPSTTSTTTTTTIVTPTTIDPFQGLMNAERTLWTGGHLRMQGEQLARFADIVCSGFRNGLTAREIVTSMITAVNNNGGNSDDITYLAKLSGAAVAWMCPDMASRLNNG
jgi:Leucine-rich repeat (LRR) protein